MKKKTPVVQNKRKPYARKATCTFNHSMAIEITQAEARCVAQGGFLPRTVADKMIASIEELYQQTEGRERIAKLVDPTLVALL